MSLILTPDRSIRSRPDALFLDDPSVIVSFDAVAAFNEYFSSGDYWRQAATCNAALFSKRNRPVTSET